MFAPIIIFAYKREDHLKQTIINLERCDGCDKSDVFIFSDGYKGEQDKNGVFCVREYLKQVKHTNPFKSVTIIEALENKGLSKNVIEGVTMVIKKYDKVIVIEDDTIVAPSFLTFMNQTLEFYKYDNNIFSIGGYMLPMKFPKDYSHDILYAQRMSSCCWGTWLNRWEKIEWNMPDYNTFRFNPAKRHAFNRWGNDRSSMLDDQMNGRINSWAIRFDYYMWKNNMFNVYPVNCLAQNIGMDGSGTHGVCNILESSTKCWNPPFDIKLEKLSVREDIRKEFCKSYKCPRIKLVKRYLGNLVLKYRGKIK